MTTRPAAARAPKAASGRSASCGAAASPATAVAASAASALRCRWSVRSIDRADTSSAPGQVCTGSNPRGGLQEVPYAIAPNHPRSRLGIPGVHMTTLDGRGDDRRTRFDRFGPKALGVSLYWRVFAVNAAILAAAVVLLIVTPVTIDARPTPSQLLVLARGLLLLLVANAWLVRFRLRPPRRRPGAGARDARGGTPDQL